MTSMRWCAALAMAGAALAGADTVWLKDGVNFDGVVKQRPDGVYEIDAGGRTVLYRAEDVLQIEKNEKTGRFDRAEVEARWAEEDARLTRETGLDAEQRSKAEEAMYRLQSHETGERAAARDALLAMHAKFDVFAYLARYYPEMSHRMGPPLLEVLFLLDAGRAMPLVKESIGNRYAGTRAAAIALAAKAGEESLGPLIARGLADHDIEVRIVAAKALAALRVRGATPALIGNLKHPDLRVNNATRDALFAMWEAESGGQRLQTVQEWEALWEAQAAKVSGKMALADLAPLVAEEDEYQDE